SGVQLFGSVTFQMLWRDGYRALDALDDNRDGRLEGAELDGLAVWFDRNGDGVSQRDEVVPIELLGVKTISVSATGVTGESPMSAAGVTMQDGRVLPTYDWMAEPLNR